MIELTGLFAIGLSYVLDWDACDRLRALRLTTRQRIVVMVVSAGLAKALLSLQLLISESRPVLN